MTENLGRLKTLPKIWRASFVLVVVSFFLVMGSSVLAPDEALTVSTESWNVKLVFFAFFALIAALVVNSVFLWISMLVFLMRFDGRGAGKRALWFCVVLFGLSYGAAVYYFFSVRPMLAKYSQT